MRADETGSIGDRMDVNSVLQNTRQYFQGVPSGSPVVGELAPGASRGYNSPPVSATATSASGNTFLQYHQHAPAQQNGGWSNSSPGTRYSVGSQTTAPSNGVVYPQRYATSESYERGKPAAVKMPTQQQNGYSAPLVTRIPDMPNRDMYNMDSIICQPQVRPSHPSHAPTSVPVNVAVHKLTPEQHQYYANHYQLHHQPKQHHLKQHQVKPHPPKQHQPKPQPKPSASIKMQYVPAPRYATPTQHQRLFQQSSNGIPSVATQAAPVQRFPTSQVVGRINYQQQVGYDTTVATPKPVTHNAAPQENPAKRESPLDLSVKLVRHSADSTREDPDRGRTFPFAAPRNPSFARTTYFPAATYERYAPPDVQRPVSEFRNEQTTVSITFDQRKQVHRAEVNTQVSSVSQYYQPEPYTVPVPVIEAAKRPPQPAEHKRSGPEIISRPAKSPRVSWRDSIDKEIDNRINAYAKAKEEEKRQWEVKAQHRLPVLVQPAHSLRNEINNRIAACDVKEQPRNSGQDRRHMLSENGVRYLQKPEPKTIILEHKAQHRLPEQIQQPQQWYQNQSFGRREDRHGYVRDERPLPPFTALPLKITMREDEPPPPKIDFLTFHRCTEADNDDLPAPPRFRTKAELKQVPTVETIKPPEIPPVELLCSNASEILTFSSPPFQTSRVSCIVEQPAKQPAKPVTPLNTPEVANKNVTSTFVVPEEKPKPHRKRLFSRETDTSSDDKRKSSSETSVYDFIEGDSDSDLLHIGDLQTLKEMRKDSKEKISMLKERRESSVTPSVIQELNEEKSDDSQWKEACEELIYQIENRGQKKRAGRKKKTDTPKKTENDQTKIVKPEEVFTERNQDNKNHSAAVETRIEEEAKNVTIECLASVKIEPEDPEEPMANVSKTDAKDTKNDTAKKDKFDSAAWSTVQQEPKKSGVVNKEAILNKGTVVIEEAERKNNNNNKKMENANYGERKAEKKQESSDDELANNRKKPVKKSSNKNENKKVKTSSVVDKKQTVEDKKDDVKQVKAEKKEDEKVIPEKKDERKKSKVEIEKNDSKKPKVESKTSGTKPPADAKKASEKGTKANETNNVANSIGTRSKVKIAKIPADPWFEKKSKRTTEKNDEKSKIETRNSRRDSLPKQEKSNVGLETRSARRESILKLEKSNSETRPLRRDSVLLRSKSSVTFVQPKAENKGKAKETTSPKVDKSCKKEPIKDAKCEQKVSNVSQIETRSRRASIMDSKKVKFEISPVETRTSAAKKARSEAETKLELKNESKNGESKNGGSKNGKTKNGESKNDDSKNGDSKNRDTVKSKLVYREASKSPEFVPIIETRRSKLANEKRKNSIEMKKCDTKKPKLSEEDASGIVTRTRSKSEKRNDEKGNVKKSPEKNESLVEKEQEDTKCLRKRSISLPRMSSVQMVVDGTKITAHWREDLFEYKVSVRTPLSLINLLKPANWSRGCGPSSLPDLERIETDTDIINGTKKSAASKKQGKLVNDKEFKESIDSLKAKFDEKIRKRDEEIKKLVEARLQAQKKAEEQNTSPELISLRSKLLDRIDVEKKGLKKGKKREVESNKSDEESLIGNCQTSVEDKESFEPPFKLVALERKSRSQMKENSQDRASSAPPMPHEYDNTIVFIKTEPISDDERKECEPASKAADATAVRVKKKTKTFRRKCRSSGFDYIRKKKKQRKDDDLVDEEKKKPVISSRPTPESIEDIQNEIKTWVVNKGVGESILHKAARSGYLDICAYCLEKLEINPSATDFAGYTPLHEACTKGHMKVAKMLLMYGADVSASANGGIRPLHEAIETGNIELVRLLLSYGADPCLNTYAGQSPISLVKDEHDSMREFLLLYMADIQGNPSKTWPSIPVFGDLAPEESGYDPLAYAPSPPFVDDYTLNVELSDLPMPHLYKFDDELDLWTVSSELPYRLRDTVLKQDYEVRQVSVKVFREKASCICFLDDGKCAVLKARARCSFVTLVKYCDRLAALLGIRKVSMVG